MEELGKYTVLKKFCNNDRPPNQRIVPGQGRPNQCSIGAWYPGEKYTGKDGVVDPKEVKRLVSEGLIAKGSPKAIPTIDDLKDGQGLRVGNEIVTGQEPSDENEAPDLINSDEEDELNEPPADGEEEPAEEPVEEPKAAPKAKRGGFRKKG